MTLTDDAKGRGRHNKVVLEIRRIISPGKKEKKEGDEMVAEKKSLGGKEGLIFGE